VAPWLRCRALGSGVSWVPPTLFPSLTIIHFQVSFSSPLLSGELAACTLDRDGGRLNGNSPQPTPEEQPGGSLQANGARPRNYIDEPLFTVWVHSGRGETVDGSRRRSSVLRLISLIHMLILIHCIPCAHVGSRRFCAKLKTGFLSFLRVGRLCVV
jgi:hypothetical protein